VRERDGEIYLFAFVNCGLRMEMSGRRGEEIEV